MITFWISMAIIFESIFMLSVKFKPSFIGFLISLILSVLWPLGAVVIFGYVLFEAGNIDMHPYVEDEREE